jgi:proprotein convertase subtilisin/kexin type 5
MTGYLDLGLAICSYVSCQYYCLTCANINSCASCDSSSQRTFNGSSCPCNNNYYDDGIDMGCLKCHYSCLTCTSSSNTACLSCNSNNYRTYMNYNKSCPCMSKYYNVNNVAVCSLCQYSCQTCTTSSACATCNITRGRNQTTSGVGYCTCINPYYDNLVN